MRTKRIALYFVALLGVATCALSLALVFGVDWDKRHHTRAVMRIFDADGQPLERKLARLAGVGLTQDEATAIAGKYGSSAVPSFSKCLTTPGCDPAAQSMACLVLAKTPGVEGRDAIMAHIKERLSARELTREQTRVLTFSMMALGQIADEVSLKLLEDLVGRSYWQPPQVTPVLHRYPGEEDLTGDKARTFLRQTAMSAGFGNVARERQPEILMILRRLRDGEASDIYGQVDFEILNTERYLASRPSRLKATP